MTRPLKERHVSEFMNKPVPASPAQISDEPIWVGSKEWVRREEEKKFSASAAQLKEIVESGRSRLEPVEAPKLSDEFFEAINAQRSTPNREPVEAVSAPHDSGIPEHLRFLNYRGEVSTPLPQQDGFEDVLIKRAGEYRDMGREYRKEELYEAACACEDKASGLHVALKLYRDWRAAK